MPTLAAPSLHPRKSPVQARSAANVDAILEATIQILLHVGKERLTTTRVAARAGVSVGTLYQYFPNKSSLLQAVLRRHLNAVTLAVEQSCEDLRGRSPAEMAHGLVTRFLAAKLHNPQASVAMYAVSDQVDGAAILSETRGRTLAALANMLQASALSRDPHTVALMLEGALVGVRRRLLESGSIEARLPAIRAELIFLVESYLCAAALAT